VSRCAIQNTIKKFRIHNRVQDLPRSGRPKKTTTREQRNLTRLSKKHPKWTARELLKQWKTVQPVCLSTTKAILRKYGLYGRVAAKKPLLTKRHKETRLSWCYAYKHWTAAMWKKIVFTDEAKIELKPRVRKFVRRPVGTRFLDKFTTKTLKFGGGAIMVWGAIKGNGDRKLIKCEGNVDSTEYQRILTSGLLPLLERDEFLQQDGAPCHRSKSTQHFLDSRGISMLSDWPPQSPDMNIIEPLWHELKQRVASRKPATASDLWAVCQEEWNAIPREKITNLYDDMRRRVLGVIASKGGPTKY